MKKILSIIFSLAFVLIGALAFVGCGNEKTGSEVYNLIKSQMEIMLEEGTPFVSSTEGHISSKYMLNNFYKKIDNTTKTDYGWQNELIALGLNYVEKYYPLVETIERQNADSLIKSINELNASFQTLKEEYLSTHKISEDEDMTIYNGFIAKYGEEARTFSGRVYSFAKELMLFLEKTMMFQSNANLSNINLQLYIDSRILEIYSDYNEFLLVNCKGAIGVIPSEVLYLQKMTIKDSYTSDQLEKLQQIFNALNAERMLTRSIMEKFSYYDYKVVYNEDISAYQKSCPLAKAYLTQIRKYFLNNTNYILLTEDYLTENILK